MFINRPFDRKGTLLSRFIYKMQYLYITYICLEGSKSSHQLFVILYTLSIYPSVHTKVIQAVLSLFKTYIVY